MDFLANPLAALGYEERPLRLAHLAPWLEDRHIRQLTTDARGPLRAEQPDALKAYLEELGASEELLEIASAGDADCRVCSWLVSLALHYEYGDKQSEHEKAATASVVSLIAADDPELLGLATALNISAGSTATDTLQSVVKAARQRPRSAPPPTAPPPPKRPAPAPAAAESSASGGSRGSGGSAGGGTAGGTQRAARAERAPLAGLGPDAFPLGFATGSDDLDAAARVLRMLHVRELRRYVPPVPTSAFTVTWRHTERCAGSILGAQTTGCRQYRNHEHAGVHGQPSDGQSPRACRPLARNWERYDTLCARSDASASPAAPDATRADGI